VPGAECVRLLQWGLPKLGLEWRGFRKIRRIVRRRIERRLAELHLPDTAAYRRYLETHSEEWRVLDRACRIPVSRFYRDRAVFECSSMAVTSAASICIAGANRTWRRSRSVTMPTRRPARSTTEVPDRSRPHELRRLAETGVWADRRDATTHAVPDRHRALALHSRSPW
jgi:hypothetical protein